MRSRSNSGVRLDYYQRMVQKTILKYQNPVSGLIPATPGNPHAWVRDNVYSALAVWALALAYKKTADLDEDRAKAYEMEQSVVKLMRGLLFCMMKQLDKVEKFKFSQSVKDALHAKYDVQTGNIAVGDFEWGHLQIDATSLYLLMLAQMTASGLQIIYTLDEVAFVQNLVFYIQATYRIPDYGIWERGDKTNHGVPELNATSIGMAKAALEALNELDLFGARGGPPSVIHVMPDEAQQCQAILHSVLPRESNSKETDAGLLSIISYPAFAVDDQELIDITRETLIKKLRGRYGLCRFLRDGYKTPKEDVNRLHYELSELAVFENIECQWPLFYAYLVLDGLFNGKDEQVEEYSKALDEVMIRREDGMKLMPELYVVPPDKVDAEYKEPRSQDRVAAGKLPHMWGQSLYVLGRLIKEGYLSPGEIDPLNRRLVAEPKPDIVVQVVILAEDVSMQERLAYYDLKVQTFAEVAPIQVYPARVLSHLFSHLGRNRKLKLSGRPTDVVGILATSRLYALSDQTLAFFPQSLDLEDSFYYVEDSQFLLDLVWTDLAYVARSWRSVGRPLFIWPLHHRPSLDVAQALHPALIATMKKLQTGYINGARVHLGNLSDFTNTSCVTNLTFLTETDDSPDLTNLLNYIERLGRQKVKESRLLSKPRRGGSGWNRARRKTSVAGIVRRSCSIQINPEDMPTDLRMLAQGFGQSSSPHGSFLGLPGALVKSAFPAAASSGGTTPPSFPTSPGASSTGEAVGSFSFAVESEHPSHLLRGDIIDKGGAVVQAYHDTTFEGVDCKDLVEQLKDTESLHEQADIIHYLFLTKGPEWDTEMEGKAGCKIKDLLKELYEKAGHLKQWWLVRHTAGMLRKRVEDLSKAATDIIVRQKQLAVGLPPEPREKIITRPLPPDELADLIHEACGENISTSMLTQEILVYLAMFIRTEPRMFSEMLRLRVGLIIQVMASELARTLKCSGEDASDELMNLSPYEMKTLLHHILSGKEFGVVQDPDNPNMSVGEMIASATKKSTADQLNTLTLDASATEQIQESMASDRHGQWLRRRRLDGALNRVPVGFYEELWKVLRRCHGLSIIGNVLSNSLTREMTPGEFKFALQVEMILNRIPQPEYRQLMVECMMILCLIVEHDNGKVQWNETIPVDKLVHIANEIFIEEQTKMDGDVTLCCGIARTTPLKCGGTAGICQNFYDTAPSGRYGTMSYICRAAVKTLHFPVTGDGNLDCIIS